jgi:hypothetical protein
MLGHLRMSVDEGIDALIGVATTIFLESSQDMIDPEINSKKLKDAIEKMLQIRGIPVNTKMYQPDHLQTRCKVYAYSLDVIYSSDSPLLGFCTRQRQLILTTLKHSAPTPLEDLP